MYFIDDFQFSSCPAENDTKSLNCRNDFCEAYYHKFHDKTEDVKRSGVMRPFLQPAGIKDYGY